MGRCLSIKNSSRTDLRHLARENQFTRPRLNVLEQGLTHIRLGAHEVLAFDNDILDMGWFTPGA